MSFPRYERYKDSGVEWLGEVPEHWYIQKFSRCAFFQEGPGLRNWQFTQDGVRVICVTNITDSGVIFSNYEKFISNDEYQAGYRRFTVSNSDLLLSSSGNSWGKVAEFNSNEVAILNTSTIRVNENTSHTATRSFIKWLLLSLGTYEQLGQFITGACQPNFGPSHLSRIFVAIPPKIEQHGICDFLERQTTKIDELIAEQQRLIELLKEKITSLVLSSLNSTVTQELLLENAARIISRPVIQSEGELYIPIGLFNRGRGLFHKEPREMNDMGDSDFFWIEECDLILSGQFAWEGAVALAGKEDTGCVVSHRYPVLRGQPGICLTEYLFALLLTKHGDFLLNENSRGAAGRNRPLNINSLMKEKIPVADMQTQEKVAQAVHWRNILSTEISKQIDLLKERRTALISAAVTGKIDVRAFVTSEEKLSE